MKKIVLIVVPLLVVLILSFKSIESSQSKGNSVCDSLSMSSQEHLVMSVLWYQRSAEMRAMYYQSFYLAKLALDKKLADDKSADKKGVVFDLDETVLDNSPYEAMMIQKGLDHSNKFWREWTKMAVAKATPGVVDFINYAKSKGVIAFYVSNREMGDRDVTINNLQKDNLPYADSAHVMLRVNGNNDKTPRYEKIAEHYKILLTFGDNLRDFKEIFGNRKVNYGFNMADSLKEQYGVNFIMLPNPMYGDWEKAIYHNTYPSSDLEKSKLRKAALLGY
jgi:5'-nucleotidase (lipoprotein e(P4) family)